LVLMPKKRREGGRFEHSHENAVPFSEEKKKGYPANCYREKRKKRARSFNRLREKKKEGGKRTLERSFTEGRGGSFCKLQFEDLFPFVGAKRKKGRVSLSKERRGKRKTYIPPGKKKVVV